MCLVPLAAPPPNVGGKEAQAFKSPGWFPALTRGRGHPHDQFRGIQCPLLASQGTVLQTHVQVKCAYTLNN